jgi:hypothetical protein
MAKLSAGPGLRGGVGAGGVGQESGDEHEQGKELFHGGSVSVDGRRRKERLRAA